MNSDGTSESGRTRSWSTSSPPRRGIYEERALYIAEGTVEIDGIGFSAGELLVFRSGSEIVFQAFEPSRVLLLGGEPMDGPRHIFSEFIPLPEEPAPVRYP